MAQAERVTDTASMLDNVINLVRQVGDNVVMPRFLNVVRQHKDDGSVLTEADLAAQAALEVGLKAIADCPIVGEEMTEEQQRRNWEAGASGLWCIDPIDGTSNFVSGLCHFAVSVAYMQQGRPVLAVIYAPVMHELFYAEAGKGAYLLSDDLEKVKLPFVTGAVDLQQATGGVDFKRLPKNLAIALAIQPPFQSHRNYGAATLDWSYLAAGRLDVYLHGGQKLWDYAAACLILQEAGGQMRTLNNEDFWTGDVWQKSVIAARKPDLFATWNDWLAQYR